MFFVRVISKLKSKSDLSYVFCSSSPLQRYLIKPDELRFLKEINFSDGIT